MGLIFELMTVNELLLCCLVVFFGAVLQVSTGMGFGMFASPLIAIIKPELVPGTILIIGLVVAFAGAWRERSNIVLVELKLGFLGRVIGSFLAVVILLFVPDRDVFMLLFGTLILAAVLLSSVGIDIAFSRQSLLGLSVVSGLMGTITAVGAPPMALIYRKREPALVRPTLNAFFFCGSLLGCVGLAAAGWLSLNELIAAIVFLPAMAIGVVAARFFMRIPSVVLSRMLLLLSAVAALSLIIRAAV